MTPCLGGGGAERWVLSLIKAFSSAVKVIGIYTPALQGELLREARNRARVFGPGEHHMMLGHCDVVIAWGMSDLANLCEQFTGRIIAVSHGTADLDWTLQINRAMALCPRVEKVGVSPAAALAWGADANAAVIQNGVELDRCCPRQSREKTREQFGIPQEAFVALYGARFSHEKRPFLFADAIPHLGPDWVGVMAGADSAGIASQLAAKPQIMVLPFQDSLGDLFAACDVYVLPSITEAHPLALTEAWAAEISTVYGDWAFAKEVLEFMPVPLEEPGYTIGLDMDAEEVAEQIEEGRDNYMVGYAREMVWKHFTASAMAQRWEDFLFSPSINSAPVS